MCVYECVCLCDLRNFKAKKLDYNTLLEEKALYRTLKGSISATYLVPSLIRTL